MARAKAKKPAAKAKSKTASGTAAAAGAGPLQPPPGGAIVRMYRIGHGDCFLIAFAGKDPAKPAYVLIDCGYKPGSPGKLEAPTKVKEIGQDIIATTGGFVDVAVVTHEHQDHVNGLKPANFPGLQVGKVWFAWTENPKDDIANQLRKKFKDRLLGLLDARVGFLGLGLDEAAQNLDWYLRFELGGETDDDDLSDFNGGTHRSAAGKDPEDSENKKAMRFLRECAEDAPEYLYPHDGVRAVPGAESARAFVLGPPRDVSKIDDLNPIGDETFGDDHGLGFGAAAGGVASSQTSGSPFQTRHVLRLDEVFDHSAFGAFFREHYGSDAAVVADAPDGKTVPDNVAWRRMSKDDAADAGALALAMNNATNNSSVVLAFELSEGGKVLLFVGDAQAGNWRSWADDVFDDNGKDVTAQELLGRTVLYKVGHHGSHNATLKGKEDSKEPCLAWMAKGRHAAEFVAMIPAVEEWAHQKPMPNWNHPLPAIKQALLEKCGGRVLQTDSPVPAMPNTGSAAGWQAFADRVSETPMYFDLRIDP